ncbi:MAG: hypothetical protein QOG60_1698, partial [Frankiaceae bacterium]|nr:hypothetical protein [Frankiaceae bacterium]
MTELLDRLGAASAEARIRDFFHHHAHRTAISQRVQQAFRNGQIPGCRSGRWAQAEPGR